MFTLILILILSALVLWKYLKNDSKYPPKFPSVPLLGSVPFVGPKQGASSQIQVYASKHLRKKYGDIFTYTLGNQNGLIVMNFRMAKDIANDDRFFGRLQNDYTMNQRGYNGNIGVIETEGQLWKDNRKFALTTLAKFGMGKLLIDDIIAKEAQETLDYFKKGDLTNYKFTKISIFRSLISYSELWLMIVILLMILKLFVL